TPVARRLSLWKEIGPQRRQLAQTPRGETGRSSGNCSSREDRSGTGSTSTRREGQGGGRTYTPERRRRNQDPKASTRAE
ncbi:hypothetical protein PFISCL1PPCAC_8463, partial [Pristionchus fissidentatus]